jgi:protein-tyrosine phosphatase
MPIHFTRACAATGVALAFAYCAAASASETVSAQRSKKDAVLITWEGTAPVDVFVADKPSLSPSQMRLVSDDDRDGRHEHRSASGQRPYFLLRWEDSGDERRIAERVLPLENGSNFRDVGGYETAEGKHVRWGLIYRTGAMPKLTDRDYDYLGSLDIRVLCDLRSSEERELSPTQWQQISPRARYVGIDYPASEIFQGLTAAISSPGTQSAAASPPRKNLYRDWPTSLAPQYKEIFSSLLAGEAPLAFNCSAGQDRTGVATALVLTALGVPRETILEDYHLSTVHRRPQFERSDVDYEKLADTNIVARFYSESSKRGVDYSKPRPLYGDSGRARLLDTFDEIERRWGSVDRYLGEVLGVDKKDIDRLRSLYLE